MKNKIDRLRTKTSRFSIRSVAIVLCFVMLLTAVGSGSVLSAIAASVNRPTVVSAVKDVIDGADVDEALLQKKGDSDLAETGSSSNVPQIYGKLNGAASWSDTKYNATYAFSDASYDYFYYDLTAAKQSEFRIYYKSYDWSAANDNNNVQLTGETWYDSYRKTYKTWCVTPTAACRRIWIRATDADNPDIDIMWQSSAFELHGGTAEGNWGHDGLGDFTADPSNPYLFTYTHTFTASTQYLYVTTDGTGKTASGTAVYYKNNDNTHPTLTTSSSVTLTAKTSSDYGGVNGSVKFVAGANAYKFTFNPITRVLSVELATYNVTITAGSNGTISTSPASLTGLTGSQTITVTATPDTGYHPVWPAGFTSTGTNTATVTVTGAATYNVTFEKDTYTLTKAAVAEGGSFTLSPDTSPQAWGTEITVTPTPATGYAVDTIKYNSTDITEAKKFTMPKANTTVTVTFKKVDYTITKGTVSGDGCDITIDKKTANYQDTVTVTCTPATGYKISTVKYGGNNATKSVSNENIWTFNMPAADTTVTAEFVKEDYAITKTVSPESSGTISVKKSDSEVNKYNIGDSLSLSATPATHYTFTNFTVSGATTATLTDNPATLNMSGKTGAVTVTANFEKTTYTDIKYVGMYSTTGADGSYTNSFVVPFAGLVDHGTNQDGISITAPVVTGYTFYKWTSTGGTIENATSATTTFKPTENGQTVTAQYKKNYTVTATAGTHGSVTTATSVTVPAGDTASFGFTPDAGYGLSSVMVNGVNKLDKVYTDPHTFTTEPITADTTVAASFALAITAKAKVSNTNLARTTSSTRFHYGTGTVAINGGTPNASAADAIITPGATVTFTATPDDGWGFGGWYAEETCEHLVSSEQTMTIPVSENNKTYYAAFVEDHYYLVGKFYLADYAQYHQEGHSSTNFRLTPDSSNPGLFTYENDFMFKQYTENSSNIYHLQYVSVSWGSESNGMYSTDKQNAESEYPSSGIEVDNDNCWKWRIGEETGTYSNTYQHVKITWDAINEKLSWKITPIDMSEYTVIKVKADATWTWDHIWCNHADSYLKLIGLPSETIGGDVYNVLLVKNDTIGNGGELKCKFHKQNSSSDGAATGGDNETAEFNGMFAGGVYTITPNSSGGAATCTDSYYISGQYTNGEAGFFKSASGTTAATTDAMAAGSGGTFTWETPAGAATDNGCIPTGVIQFKVLKNPDANDYTEASYPEYAQSYRIKSNITKLKFSYNCADHSITVTPTYKEQPWYYSGTAAASRTAVDPINSMTAFTASDSSTYGKIRFMGGTSDNGLDTAITPSYHKTGATSNAYWADLTSSIGTSKSYYFGLCLQSNKGDLIGNKSEEINDSNNAEARTIQDNDGNTLFKLQFQSRDDVSNQAKYVYISAIDWSRVTAIGVKAYDNSKATCNTWNNPHNGLVDYQIYYRPTAPAEPDPIPEPGTVKTVDIYAKDATLRDNTFNRFALLADTSIDLSTFEFTDPGTGTVYDSVEDYNLHYADEKSIDRITAVDTSKHAAYGSGTSPDRGAGYEVVQNVPVGAKIKIKTQLADSRISALDFGKAFDQTHYLKAYSYNGMTYQVHTASDMTNGLVEETWTVRDVNTFRDVEGSVDKTTLMKDQKTIEITPIYYLQDNTNTRTFYIEGYDGTVQQAWGNMLSVYPYYEGKSNKENAFGGYPGQPMLLWGGKYQMEVPLTVDGSASGATVKGLTLHNGYWDLLHRELDLIAGKQHAQTYDFDDFYKLNKEKNPDSIIFDFKYFSKAAGTDNFNDGYDYTNYTFAASTTSDVTKNPVEDLTDYYNRKVDAFGTVLNDTEAANTPLTFVSTGYKDTYVGEYATIWAVYKPDKSFLGYISSSMLYLNNIDRVKQYTDGTNTAKGRMSWDQFINTYNTLKSNYTRTPVKISYEKELWNDSKDKANRSDGRWYYSKNTDKVSAKIKIQYGPADLIDKADKSLSSNAWKDDAFDASKTGVGGEHNIGSVTGCSAYFTNTTPVNLNGKTESGSVFSDTTKYFNFKAQASGSYIFAGWVRLNNGKYYEISESEIGQSNMSANDTYIARFVEAKAGTLIVSHDIEQTDVFKGTGTPSITVLIKDGATTVDTLTNNKGENIDLTKYIKTANRHYTIDISLSTDPDEDSESYMKEIVSSAGNFAATPATFNTGSGTPSTEEVNATVKQFTVNDILDTGVTNLRYVSHLMKPEYHYSYDITYTYNSRFYGEQSYTVSGTFGAVGKPAADGNMTGAKTTAKLTDDFIINQTPYEKNFREKINWNYTDKAVGKAGAMVSNTAELDLTQSNTYKMTAHVYSANTVDDSVKAEFLLPYPHQDQENGYKIAPVTSYYKDGSGNDAVYNENDYIFDESQESVTIKTQAYGLFTYDDKEDADDLNLIEAAPYVWKDPEARYSWKSDSRYYTGNSFKIGDISYYCDLDPNKPTADATHVILTASNTANWDNKEVKYAISTGTGNDQVVYTFEEYIKGDAFTNGYNVYSKKQELDGFYLNQDGTSSIGQKMYFTRWDIFNSDGDLVANGYDRFFNFTGYENYLIKAVYESNEPAQTGTSPDGTMATITYLGDTRNQWNNGHSGSNAREASDELYADFAIAYRYNGEQIDQIDSSTPIKTGMIIERLDAVDDIGGTKMTDISYYVDKYKNTATTTTVSNIKTALENNHTETDSTINSALRSTLSNPAMNSRIGANVEGWGSQFGTEASDATTKMNFNSVIDNFNRLQWCYNFKNNKDGEGNVKNAKYVFRAWSYIIVDGVATVSSTPAYFTFYDTAVR